MSTQNPFNEELLSAYVDGELSESQRLEVEKALDAQPDLRKLHEEMLSIRVGLKSVPHQVAPDCLADSVMTRVRAISNADGDGILVRRSQAHPREHGWARGVVWSVMAIATAIVVMLFLPEQQDHTVSQNSPDDRAKDVVVAEAGDAERAGTDNDEAGHADASTDNDADSNRDEHGMESPLDRSQIASDDIPKASLRQVDASQDDDTRIASQRHAGDDGPQPASPHPVDRPRVSTADFGVDRVVRLRLSDEDALRKLAANHDVEFVEKKVSADLSEKLLVVESPVGAIDEILQQLEQTVVPDLSDAAKSDDLALNGASRFSLTLDLDPDLAGVDVRRYRRSKPATRKEVQHTRTLFILE